MKKTFRPDPDEVLITSALRRGVEPLLNVGTWDIETERPAGMNDIVLGEVVAVPASSRQFLEINSLELVKVAPEGPVIQESGFREGFFLGVAGNRYAPPYIVGGLTNPLTGSANRPVKGNELTTGLFSLGPVGFCNHCCIETPGPTLRIFGVLTDQEGASMNLRRFKERVAQSTRAQAVSPQVVVVAGHSSNAGKTTCAQAVVAGLRDSGKRVGYVKMTGTASCRDLKRVYYGASCGWELEDRPYRLWPDKTAVRDFVDGLGVVSDVSMGRREFVQKSVTFLERHAEVERLDAVVVELADGLCHASNLALLAYHSFSRNIAALVYCPIPSSEGVHLFHSFWSSHVCCRNVPLILSGPFANESVFVMDREEATTRLDVDVRRSARLEQGHWMADGEDLMEGLIPLLDKAKS